MISNINWLQKCLDFRQNLFGPNNDELIFKAIVGIAHAELSERHHDVTSLANALNIPRTNCQRYVDKWEKAGFVRRHRLGRRVLLSVTAESIVLINKYLHFLELNEFPKISLSAQAD